MAANGLLSESAAATALGMPFTELRRVITEHPPSQKIWNDCLAIERDTLLKSLYSAAVGGDTKAAQTLLAVRHGLSEKQPQGASERVSVVFNLPAAMSPEDYLKAVKVEPERLTHE